LYFIREIIDILFIEGANFFFFLTSKEIVFFLSPGSDWLNLASTCYASSKLLEFFLFLTGLFGSKANFNYDKIFINCNFSPYELITHEISYLKIDKGFYQSKVYVPFVAQTLPLTWT